MIRHVGWLKVILFFFLCILLLLQGRPLLARLGRRTVLVLDVPYVHQLLEAYVSKLFSLSYGVASVDVHGADPADQFVHCFTHRSVVRNPCQPTCFCSGFW